MYAVAQGLLGLAIPLREGKNESQLCAGATTDTFPRFTSPEPGNSQRKLVFRLRANRNSMDSEAPVVARKEQEAHQLVELSETAHCFA